MEEKVKADQVLDDDALSLFQEIGGIDETNRLTPLGEIKEDDSDDWKLLFVEFAELVAWQLSANRTDGAADKDAPEIEGSAIDAIIEKLDTMTGFAGKQKTLLLRNRGMVFSAEPQAEREYDYELSFGKLVADLPVTKEIAEKKPDKFGDLPARLNNAFATFSLLEINTLQIELGQWSKRDRAIAKACLQQVLPKFYATSRPASFPLVFDEKGRPNPNLTAVAAINRMKKESAQGLVKKVAAMMKKSAQGAPAAAFANVFDAMFAVKKLKAQLAKPNVLINNVRYLELLKDCFNASGRFLRGVFEKNIPEFVKAERNVFGFLWNDFKRVRNKQDSVAFLNALQLVIAEMKLPHEAAKLLLEDFSADPKTISTSDRNALLLSTLLLRNYNKELGIDIELTPEEVLRVQDGLNGKMVAYVSKLIDSNLGEDFYQKIVESHKKLIRTLEGGKGERNPLPAKFLVSLEREACIFLSLIGGPTARKIVRDAVEEYGDPESKIYGLKKSKQAMRSLLPLLQTAARGLVRFSDPEDLPLLEAVGARSTQFKTVVSNQAFRDLVDRVMEYVDASAEELYEKTEGGEGEYEYEE